MRLILRDVHRDAFDKAQRQRFLDRLAALLQRYLPECVAETPEDRLTWLIGDECDRVAKYVLIQEHALGAYVLAVCALGFAGREPKPPWVTAAFEDPDLAPNEAAQLIRYLAEAQLLAEATGGEEEQREALRNRAVRLRAAALAARRDLGRNVLGQASPNCALVGVPEEAVPAQTRSELLAGTPAVQECLRGTVLQPLRDNLPPTEAGNAPGENP